MIHFSLATIGYNRYIKNLKLGMNPIRFYEYALSSSRMIVLISMLPVLRDLGAIILSLTSKSILSWLIFTGTLAPV